MTKPFLFILLSFGIFLLTVKYELNRHHFLTLSLIVWYLCYLYVGNFTSTTKCCRGIVGVIASSYAVFNNFRYASLVALSIEVVIVVWVAKDVVSKLASSDSVPCSAQIAIKCAFPLKRRITLYFAMCDVPLTYASVACRAGPLQVGCD